MAPMRVASLLPSSTEIIAALLAAPTQDQLDGQHPVLVARSHECDHPAWVRSLPVLTGAKTTWTSSSDVDKQVREKLAAGEGLYTVDEAALRALAPDAIITQSLCSVCSVDYGLVARAAKRMQPQPLVLDLNPQSLADVVADVRRLGAALRAPAAGEAAAAALEARVGAAGDLAAQLLAAAEQAAGAEAAENGGLGQRVEHARPRVAFMEWVDPIFVGGHWTPELIRRAGGSHPLNSPRPGGGAGPSFAVTMEQVAASDPDWVIICPCGLDLPTARAELRPLLNHPLWPTLRAVQHGQVVVVDGNQMFNRPGPRLVDCLEFLVGLLHGRPELIPSSFPYELLTGVGSPRS